MNANKGHPREGYSGSMIICPKTQEPVGLFLGDWNFGTEIPRDSFALRGLKFSILPMDKIYENSIIERFSNLTIEDTEAVNFNAAATASPFASASIL